ncbi:MAG: amino acid adenylation domain-containing protein [Myxococcota bacterium]
MKTLVEGFDRQVARAPEAVAVTFEGKELTYRQLDDRARRLAAELVARGIGADSIVGISVERSLELAVAVLGVLRAGAGYLPLDVEYPRERLAFMLEDARVAALVTQAHLQEKLPFAAERVLCLEQVRAEPLPAGAPRSGPEHLVYAIYTSGSTGKPKGVAMHQAPLTNLIEWQLADSRHGAGRTLQFAPLSFDVHFQEMLSTWCAGGTLVMIREELRLEAVKLLELLERERVNRLFLPFIALQSLCEVATAHGVYPSALTEVVTAGEQLQVTPQVVKFFEQLPGCTLFNHYGPSETHVVTSLKLEGAPSTWPKLPSIGREIANVTTRIVGERLEPLPRGQEGELLLGGVAVARGYLERPELTAQKFITLDGQRWYRSGDLARVAADGTIDFLGRIDGQVKVRGYRIELGEVEVAIAAHAQVKQVAVTVREDDPGDKRLVAYLVADGDTSRLVADVRAQLEGKLPEYMVPSAFVLLDTLPRTPSGKIDRRALPKPSSTRPALQQEFVAPRTELERKLAAVWAKLLRLDGVGVNDSFFELGGNSLLALKCVSQLRLELQLDVPVVKLFETPTVAGLAAFVEGGTTTTFRRRDKRGDDEPIAIIGLAGRFPGADDLETLWKNLVQGVESVTFFKPHASIPEKQRSHPRYVAARGVLQGVELFDAGFFGITPREAEVMDPQQRLLLETMWAAMENAGHAPGTVEGAVGVFAGVHNNSYHPKNVVHFPEAIERLGEFQVMVANEKDYVATRVAHKLDLHGPALSIHTACSTSLVAVVQAFNSLRNHECDLALAGGAALTVPAHTGHVYSEGGMLSADGHCRPFDAKATGTLFSDGVGAVVLKRLADAQRDGDTIHAVIRGAAINNDGASKTSFAAPSVAGQAAVIAAAQDVAGVDPRTISYIEAHGTATPLGDPIEIEGLTQAFRAKTQDTGFCAIGSIKSNFGHLTAAAGIAGLIKTTLALEHAELPPSLHFEKPNPAIDFAKTPFVVNAARTKWTASPRRAGVSSFGVGGTNAHVVLEEAPAPQPSGEARSKHLLTWSAKTDAALERATADLAKWLEAHPHANLADASFVQHVGRKAFSKRRAVVVSDVADARAALQSPRVTTGAAGATLPVAFLFPGQGSQYVGMGAALYRDEPEFRLIVDQCAELATPILGRDLREVLFPAGGDTEEARAALRNTAFTQTGLFTVEYALARLLMRWGLTPTAMLGHSVGEWVAATLAGVFSLEDAVRLVAKRGVLMQAQPPGSMLSVRLPAAEVQKLLTGGLTVASDNGAQLCVVAGPTPEVEALDQQLSAKGVVTKPLHTSHAFHSSMMDPVVEPLRAELAKVKLSAPSLTIISSATGKKLEAAQATDPSYWARHLRDTVRFREAVLTLALEKRTFVEVGPRATLATLTRQLVTDRTQPCLSTLPDTSADDAEWVSLLGALGKLWVAGHAIDWRRYHEHEHRRRIALPTYPFERTRHWLEPGAQQITTHPEPATLSPGAPRMSRKETLIPQLQKTFEEYSGLDLTGADVHATFLELGLDSLALTQVATELQRQHGIKFQFRQLVEDFTTLDALAAFLDSQLPATAAPVVAPPPAPVVQPVSAPAPVAAAALPVAPMMVMAPAPSNGAHGHVRDVIDQQLRLMAAQLQLLGAAPQQVAMPAPVAQPVIPSAPVAAAPAPAPAPVAKNAEEELAHTRYDVKKAFGAMARISTARNDELTTRQRAKLDELTKRYTAKTKKSKEYTTAHRAHLADPRVVTGFRPLVKELIYQIVIDRSKGARMWDLDGNEYIDALNGFGSNLFGHSPDFIVDAIRQQLERGYELGPQHPLAGEVAKGICELTGHERAALCNTGSEAVMGVMRIARTVTGRSLIAIMSGSYHGIFDEVIVRGTKTFKSVPAAPGILPEAVKNVLVLDYGTPETLQILRERAHELAAIMIEPVQSRRPDFQPKEFIQALRPIADQGGCALIFDEVITGFRLARGGAQEHFGVKADLCSYGKVIGGGQPIGVMAGKKEWMDALDGGHWQFGDASVPTVGVTYFAGTFVRHPIALAAAKAVIDEMKARGPALQQDLNAKTDRLAAEANAFFTEVGVPLKLKHFGSLWKLMYTEDQANGDLLFCFLRDRGIHIWDGFPCFVTCGHTEADLAQILKAIRESVTEMQEAGFLPGTPKPAPAVANALDTSKPPVPGARLGRDPQGNPAWFVPNPAEPGKFLKLN